MTIERILELRRELDRLLRELSPETRAELERRWLEGQPAAEAESTEPDTSLPDTSLEEPAPAPAPAPAASVSPPVPEPVEVPKPAGPRCGTLEILDTNGDGVISGVDRNWRYLGLWRDDGDQVVQESEVQSLFKQGIRRVSARLLSYTTSRDLEGGVWVEDAIYLDIRGRRGRETLVIDAGDLARGDRLWLEDGAGTRLDGIRALTAGIIWVSAEGARIPVLCE